MDIPFFNGLSSGWRGGMEWEKSAASLHNGLLCEPACCGEGKCSYFTKDQQGEGKNIIS